MEKWRRTQKVTIYNIRAPYLHRVFPEHFETACVIDEDVVMHPFAFRTHTHSHGKMVSGWKIIESEDGTDNWQLIGKMDPMKPQMFYPVEDKNVVLRKGDIIVRDSKRFRQRNDLLYCSHQECI